MAVACPAAGCEYSGLVDQVEGHLGGVADAAHEGLTVSALEESLHGEGSEGLPAVALGGLVLVGVLVAYLYLEEKKRQSEPSEGVQSGGIAG
jgi:hypothetical protein